MARLLLLIGALVTGSSSVVFTCNEIKKFLSTGEELWGESRVCVVIPASASLDDEPYKSYMETTYILDADSNMKYPLKNVDKSPTFCLGGLGPWFILSDATTQMECTGEKYKYAEIFLIFTSDEPNIVQVATTPTTKKLGKGTHVLVAPEGSLMIEKKAIDDGKETTLQFYTGAGKNEKEERFALMSEKFVPGASTVIIGPVTTLVIEDDVTVELTLTSFEEDQFISAQPGFSLSLMSSGRANDLQSSRPSILVSTAYGINDDSIVADAISITGTVKMDDDVGTVLNIDCYNKETPKTTDILDKTADVIINRECSSLDITYMGSIQAEEIGRSSEVIYLRIESSSDPVKNPSSDATPDLPNITTRRTLPPTSATTHSLPSSVPSTSRIPSTSTMMTLPTTSTTTRFSFQIASLLVALLTLVQY